MLTGTTLQDTFSLATPINKIENDTYAAATVMRPEAFPRGLEGLGVRGGELGSEKDQQWP